MLKEIILKTQSNLKKVIHKKRPGSAIPITTTKATAKPSAIIK